MAQKRSKLKSAEDSLSCAAGIAAEGDAAPDERRTRKTLLSRVRSGDAFAWEEFYNTYKGFIWSVALRLKVAKNFRLSDADIADLIQNVMFDFCKPGKFNFDPAAGIKFRTWLSCVVRNKLLDLVRKKTRNRPADVSERFEDVDPDRPFDDIIEAEWKNFLFSEAMRRLKSEVQPATFMAFEMLMEGQPPHDVGIKLGIKENNVYQIKCRCASRLEQIWKELPDAE
jgi:RNA polymerase sigma factor (sigma-70 family)